MTALRLPTDTGWLSVTVMVTIPFYTYPITAKIRVVPHSDVTRTVDPENSICSRSEKKNLTPSVIWLVHITGAKES